MSLYSSSNDEDMNSSEDSKYNDDNNNLKSTTAKDDDSNHFHSAFDYIDTKSSKDIELQLMNHSAYDYNRYPDNNYGISYDNNESNDYSNNNHNNVKTSNYHYNYNEDGDDDELRRVVVDSSCHANNNFNSTKATTTAFRHNNFNNNMSTAVISNNKIFHENAVSDKITFFEPLKNDYDDNPFEDLEKTNGNAKVFHESDTTNGLCTTSTTTSPVDGVLRVKNGMDATASSAKISHPSLPASFSPVVYLKTSNDISGTSASDFMKRKDRKNKRRKKEEEKTPTTLSEQIPDYKGDMKSVDEILAFIHNKNLNDNNVVNKNNSNKKTNGSLTSSQNSNTSSTNNNNKKSTGLKICVKEGALKQHHQNKSQQNNDDTNDNKIMHRDEIVDSDNINNNVNNNNNNNINNNINNNDNNNPMYTNIDSIDTDYGLLNELDIINNNTIIIKSSPLPSTQHQTKPTELCVNYGDRVQTADEKSDNMKILLSCELQPEKENKNVNINLKNNYDIGNDIKNNKNVINVIKKSLKSSENKQGMVQVDHFKDTFSMLNKYNNSKSNTVEFNNNTVIIGNTYNTQDDFILNDSQSDMTQSVTSTNQREAFVTVQKKKKIKQSQHFPPHTADEPNSFCNFKSNHDNRNTQLTSTVNFQINSKSLSFKNSHFSNSKFSSSNERQSTNVISSVNIDGMIFNNSKQQNKFQDKKPPRKEKLINDNNITSNSKTTTTIKQQQTSKLAQPLPFAIKPPTTADQPLMTKLKLNNSSETSNQSTNNNLGYFDPSQFPELPEVSRRNSTGSSVITSGNTTTNSASTALTTESLLDTSSSNDKVNFKEKSVAVPIKKENNNFMGCSLISYADIAAKMIAKIGMNDGGDDSEGRIHTRRRSLQIDRSNGTTTEQLQSKEFVINGNHGNNEWKHMEFTEQHLNNKEQQHLLNKQQQHLTEQQQQLQQQPQQNLQQKLQQKMNIDSPGKVGEMKQNTPQHDNHEDDNSNLDSSLKSDVTPISQIITSSPSTSSSSGQKKSKVQPVVFLDSKNINNKTSENMENSGFSFIFDSNLDCSKNKLTSSSSEPCFNMLSVNDINMSCQKLCCNSSNKGTVLATNEYQDSATSPILDQSQQQQQQQQQQTHFLQQQQQQHYSPHQFQHVDLINPNHYHIPSNADELMQTTQIIYPDVRVPPPPLHQIPHHYQIYPYQPYLCNSRPIPPLPPLPGSMPISRTPVQVVPPMQITMVKDDVINKFNINNCDDGNVLKLVMHEQQQQQQIVVPINDVDGSLTVFEVIDEDDMKSTLPSNVKNIKLHENELMLVKCCEGKHKENIGKNEKINIDNKNNNIAQQQQQQNYNCISKEYCDNDVDNSHKATSQFDLQRAQKFLFSGFEESLRQYEKNKIVPVKDE